MTVSICPTCWDNLRLEEELTIQPPNDVCAHCGAGIVIHQRRPGIPWKIGAAVHESSYRRAAASRVERIRMRSQSPPPPPERVWPVGEKEPGW